jgi:Fe-S cluster assembly protein SufD
VLETITTPQTGLTRQAVEELSRRRREPDWLLRLRLEAFEAYEQAPLPDQRTEGWRRTSLAGLDLVNQTPLSDAETRGRGDPGNAISASAADAAGILVQQDGTTVQTRLDPQLAERGVVLLDLAEAVRDPALAGRVQEHFGQVVQPREDKFAALHFAFFNAGAVVYVPRGVAVEQPLRVVHHFSQPGLATLVHTLVILEENTQLAYVDDLGSEPRPGPAPLASGAVELVVGRNAQLSYVQMQQWAQDVWSFSWQRARLAADASLRILNVALGSRLARNAVQVILEGNGAQADLLGVVLATGRQHIDFQTLQDHFGDASRSDLVIHNALRDRASANFTGLIRIEKRARGTESSQEQKNVLLSPKAKADSDPKLEILNNDVVRCTHGAAVGPVDPEMVFYLQSRGLTYDEAEALVLEGFFQSVLEKLASPELQSSIWAAVQPKLRG